MRKILSLIVILILVVPGGAPAQEERQPDSVLAAGGEDAEHTVAQLTASIEEMSRELAEGYRQRGLAYERQDRLDQARADYERGLVIQPELALLYYNRGLLAFKRGDYDQAVDDLSRYLESVPDSAVTLLLRGGIYYRRSDYIAAVEDFNKALEIDDGLAYFAYMNLASTYLRLGNLERAGECLDQAEGLPGVNESGAMDFVLLRTYEQVRQEWQAAR